MTTENNEARQRAEAKFKKREIQLVEGHEAWTEYRAQAIALREKTARLRALRLARESAGNRPVEKVPPVTGEARSAPE